MTKPIISKLLEDYASQYSTSESKTLAALNRETNIKVPQAVMLSGHLQGTLLQMISKMVSPQRILEIGAFTGYSAICLAQGLKDNGILHTIDIEEELQDMCLDYIKKAGLENKIIFHLGNAIDIIPTINEQFDIVFIDADKQNYAHYYDMVFPKVPIGGYIIADNVLYEGEVVLPSELQSKNAKAIHFFNTKIKADTRIEHVLLPIRDGLMIMRKVNE